MIPVLLSIASILILVLSIMDFNKGVGLFLLYKILVPLESLFIGGVMISNNIFAFFLLIVFFIKYHSLKYDYKILLPFFFLYLAQGFLIPFHTDLIPVIDQFKLFRANLISLILPFIIVNIIKHDTNQYRFFHNSLVVAIVISVAYGAFLLFTPGVNLYTEAIKELTGESVRNYGILDDFRFFGYLSSVFRDVGMYGVFLIMAFQLLYLKWMESHDMIWIILFVLTILGILFCGSRSVLFATLAAYIFYLLFRGSFTLAYKIIFALGVAALLLFMIFPQYMDFIMSVTNDSVNGSSTSMRMEQFMGCFAELEKSPLVGNGYGWTNYYNMNNGIHPVMLSFESILIQILCNNGLLGLCIWIITIITVIRRIRKTFNNRSEKRYVLQTMIMGFLFLSFFTADYGGIVFLFYFYSIVMASSFLIKRGDSSKILMAKNNN